MKKLFFLSALLLVIHWVFAAELPKLNLEVGKTYTIETINHIDTSALKLSRGWEQFRWLFTPINYNTTDQTYRVKTVLDYYLSVGHSKINNRWEETCYETGQSLTIRNAIVFLSYFKIPLLIEITRDGNIISVDCSEYNKCKNPEGLKMEMAIGDQQNIESIIQNLFFHVRNDNRSQKTERRIFGFIEEPEAFDYLIQKEDFESITLNFTPRNTGIKRFPEDNFKSEQLTLDKRTGLILRMTTKYKTCFPVDNKQAKQGYIYNESTFYQKYIPEYSLNKKSLRIFCDGEWKDTIISKANTLIKCKIDNRITGEDFVDILIGSQVNSSYRIALDKDNEFNIGLSINNPTQLILRYPKHRWGDSKSQYNKNFKKSFFAFDAGAGDRIDLELSATDSSLSLVSAKGIYSTFFNYENKFQNLIEHPLSSNSFTYSRDKYLPLLNEFRLHADPRIYLNKLVEISYWEERANITNYKRQISKMPSSARGNENKINPIENVVINNSLAKENPYYLRFLNEYLIYISIDRIQNLTGVQTFNSKTTVENRYYLAEALLAEPVKSNYLAFYIKNTLLDGNPETIKDIFESFRRNYKESAVYPEVEKAYNRFIALTPGNVAPNFTLKDIYGKKYSLNDFKKKVVVLHFDCNPLYEKGINGDFTERFIPRLEETMNNTTEDLVYIFLLNGNNKKLIELIKSKGYKGIFLIAEDGNYPSASKVNYDYNDPVSGTEFLINRNGRIVKKTTHWQSEINDEDIKNALAIPYQRSYNIIPIWIRITLISLVAALLAIALTFLFYRIIAKRRLKKSELNKRMRELELTAIRAQMNPHFLYNCLNSIQNLVQKNQNEQAHLYLSKFAALIRQVLNTSKKEEVSLAEELETIHSYIDLEKLRFDFDYQLILEEDIEPVSVFIPPMLLQPIVENALLHGLLPKSENRNLNINIRKENKHICIAVEDNGIGREATKDHTKLGNGKGLELTRERLTLMAGKYKTYYKMDIEDMTNNEGQPSGTRVTICFEEE